MIKKCTFEMAANWFGDRGIQVLKSHFKKLWLTDHYICWVPNNKSKSIDPFLTSDYWSEHRDQEYYLYASRKSMSAEVYGEDCYCGTEVEPIAPDIED